MMKKLSIDAVDLAGKRVFIRVDFNVPLQGGKVDNDNRIVAALPTIQFALNADAKVILASHLGRPKGELCPEFSLAPVAECLAARLGRPVGFASDCVGDAVRAKVDSMGEGEVLLLENLRFHPGEEKPHQEPGFAEALASLADLYINDAFGTAHRAHASMVAVAQCFERPAAGFLLAKELEYFGKALAEPRKPFVAVLGGAKVSDKILLIENLLSRVDTLLIGGAMAYTFLAARGVAVGDSRVEEDKVELAARLLEAAQKSGVEMLLPTDHRCGRSFDAATEWCDTPGDSIEPGWMGLDIGPQTTATYVDAVGGAGTVIWNGPMGVFEWEPFSLGTFAVARACAESDAVDDRRRR